MPSVRHNWRAPVWGGRLPQRVPGFKGSRKRSPQVWLAKKLQKANWSVWIMEWFSSFSLIFQCSLFSLNEDRHKISCSRVIAWGLLRLCRVQCLGDLRIATIFELNYNAVHVPRTFRSKLVWIGELQSSHFLDVCCLDDLVRETKVATFRANSLAISFEPQDSSRSSNTSGWRFKITIKLLSTPWKWMVLTCLKPLKFQSLETEGGLQLHGG